MALLDLPPELLDGIAALLAPHILKRFRLTCRKVYQCTFDAFINKLNAHRWIPFDHSLDTLAKISRHARLGPKSKTLRLDTHCPRFHTWRNSLDVLEDDPERKADYITKGRSVRLFAGTRYNFSHLRVIEIGDLGHTAGKHLEYDQEADDVESGSLLMKVFVDLLHAISKVSPRLESLSAVQLCKYEHHLDYKGLDYLGLPPLPIGGKLAQGLRKAFCNLKTLELGMQCSALGSSWETISPQRQWPHGYQPVRWLNDLLGLTPVLQGLRLHFDDIDPPASSDGKRARASAGRTNFAVLQEFCDTTLPKLKRFELSNAIVAPPQLIKWLSVHSSTLKYLSLRRVSLRDAAGTRAWPSVLESVTGVETVKASCLYEPDGKIAVFDEHNMNLCAICQPPWLHEHGCYIDIECEHISFNCTDGRIPTIRQWVGLAPTKAYSREHQHELFSQASDKDRWPVNFHNASTIPKAPGSDTSEVASNGDDWHDS